MTMDTPLPRNRHRQDPLAFLIGGGEMGARTRGLDWSRTSVGRVEGWPQSLKAAVSICLGSRHPMVVWWGNPEFTQFYNDAYISFLGPKHPECLGQSGRDCWREIWPIMEPMLESVFATGEATWSEDFLYVVDRTVSKEEAYFTFSYSPICNEDGAVGGIFCACNETTARVIGERRLRTLRDLSELAAARSPEAACEAAARILAENSGDVPFALAYLLDGNAGTARLVATTAVQPGDPAAPSRLDLTDSADVPPAWPLGEVLRSGQMLLVTDLAGRFRALPGGPWEESPESALILPIAVPGQARPTGFLVAGLSPRRVFDGEYRSFLGVVAAQVGTALASARAHEEERRRAEALAELDRAKTVFFSNVSHEFRTPLTLMLGPVEDILEKSRGDLTPDAREQLGVVHRNSLRLLKLVNTMLDFSRIEAGRVRANYEPVDLAAYTADLASVFRAAIERADLSLIVDCPPLGAAEPAYVDRDMWEKIVLNLVSNAFKFTLTGEIEVGLKTAAGAAVLSVRDTGVGIPEDELPRMFERFHRVENSRGRTYEGTGIGLALVQELARLHGGTVRVESVLNEGSRFTVTLPLGNAHLDPARVQQTPDLAPIRTGVDAFVEEALRWLPDIAPDAGQPWAHSLLRTEPDRAPPRSGAQRPRILWADDNADMREYVSRLLGDRFAVEAVADGEAAVAAARASPPDLVLADVMMPRLDGFGVMRALRADPVLATIPIILLSARAGEEARIAGAEAGADDYLIKPFSARELIARVESHVRIARFRRDAGEALRESERRFRTMVDTAPAMLWTSNPDGGCSLVSRGLCEYTGRTEAEALGHGFLGAVHPDDRDKIRRVYVAAHKNREPFTIDCRVRQPDGDYRWAIAAGHPRFAENGRFLGQVGSVIDIHDRKAIEERQKLLLEELDHRVKNTLAIVQAIANQTLRHTRDPAGFCEAFTARLMALAGAHSLLTTTQWKGASLADVAAAAMAPFRGTYGSSAIRIEGPLAIIRPGAAVTLSLMLHELATNAAKHGALTSPRGTVTMTWRRHGGNGQEPAEMELHWRERNGPPVAEPTGHGFGSRLIAASADQLGGKFAMAYAPLGLECRFRFPLAEHLALS